MSSATWKNLKGQKTLPNGWRHRELLCFLTGIPMASLNSTKARRQCSPRKDFHLQPPAWPCREKASPGAGRTREQHSSLLVLTYLWSLQAPSRRETGAGRSLTMTTFPLADQTLPYNFSIYTLVPSPSRFLFQPALVPITPPSLHLASKDWSYGSQLLSSPSREVHLRCFYLKTNKQTNPGFYRKC